MTAPCPPALVDAAMHLAVQGRSPREIRAQMTFWASEAAAKAGEWAEAYDRRERARAVGT